MWRLVHKIDSGLIISLGALHCGFTVFNYDSFSLDAIWFLGSGIAIINAGFLNIAAMRTGGNDKVISYLCLSMNLFFALLFSIALWLIPQPQVLVGVALFGIASVAVILGLPQHLDCTPDSQSLPTKSDVYPGCGQRNYPSEDAMFIKGIPSPA